MTDTSRPKARLGDFGRLGYLLTRYAWPYWKSLLVLLLGSIGATFLLALSPFILAPILDIALGKEITAGNAEPISLGNLNLGNLGAAVLQWLNIGSIGNKFTAIVILSVIWAAAGILASLIVFVNYLTALWIRVRAARDMQHDLYRHMLSLSLGFFQRQRAGELMSRLDNDTLATTSGLEAMITSLIISPVLIVFFGILIVKTSPILAVAAVAGVAVHYGVTRAIGGRIRRRVVDQFSSMADMRATLQEALTSIRVVKSFSAEGFELRKLAGNLKRLVRTNMRYGVYKHVEEPVRAGVNRVIQAGVLAVAAYQLLAGRLEVAAFFLFGYLAQSIMEHVSKLASAFVQIQSTLAASERVFELLSERPQLKDGPAEVKGFDREIHVEGVSFAYDKREVLQEVNLDIKRGQIVALVGPSGAGKTTLVDLILRFYDPAKGCIRIDGHDLRTLNQQSYRRLFGVVPQEPLLFNTTVRENIAYGRDGLSEDEIVQAARIANAHDFIINELPNGYDTLVGDRGVRLSGGQRQRIAIARAIVSKPPILIMDEATSSLDSESERLVQEAIDRVIQNTTAIVIAHRLSTVRHADKIEVFEDGRIVGQGSHQELLESNQLYRRLYEIQFADVSELEGAGSPLREQ